MVTGKYRKERTRNRLYEKPANDRVMQVIGANIDTIRGELFSDASVTYGGRSNDDILSETFEYVIRENISHLSDKDIISHFKRRFKMIQFQTIQDYKSQKQNYGNNLQERESE